MVDFNRARKFVVSAYRNGEIMDFASLLISSIGMIRIDSVFDDLDLAIRFVKTIKGVLTPRDMLIIECKQMDASIIVAVVMFDANKNPIVLEKPRQPCMVMGSNGCVGPFRHPEAAQVWVARHEGEFIIEPLINP